MNWFFVFALRTFSMKMCEYFCNAFSIRCYQLKRKYLFFRFDSFLFAFYSHVIFANVCFFIASYLGADGQSHEFNARRQHFAKDDELCICLSHFVFFYVFLVCCWCLHHFSESFSSSFNVSHSDIFYVSPFLSIQFVPSSCLIKIFQLYAHFHNIINVNKLQCCSLFRLREIKGNSPEPDNNLLPIEAVASLLLNEKVAIPFNFFFIFFAANQPI